jgi:hypothetical protein
MRGKNVFDKFRGDSFRLIHPPIRTQGLRHHPQTVLTSFIQASASGLSQSNYYQR